MKRKLDKHDVNSETSAFEVKLIQPILIN